MIEFKEIDEHNFNQVLSIGLKKEQVGFVSSVMKSLAQCWLYRDNGDVFPFAIYSNQVLVGFILFDEDLDSRKCMVWRFQIDHQYQGLGYGRETMMKAIDYAKKSGSFDDLIANYVRGNHAVAHILKVCGFKEIGFDEENNEVLMSRSLSTIE